MLLGIYAEKAFDRVDWLYLQKTLKYIGFSVGINIGRGTRYGDVFSPFLFALSSEPLEQIKFSDQRITDQRGHIHIVALFADDILFLSDLFASILVLMIALRSYVEIPGYKKLKMSLRQ